MTEGSAVWDKAAQCCKRHLRKDPKEVKESYVGVSSRENDSGRGNSQCGGPEAGIYSGQHPLRTANDLRDCDQDAVRAEPVGC